METTDYGRESTELYAAETTLVSLEREPKEGFALKAVKEGAVGKHLWLADSGASSHMTNDESGLFNMKLIESKITIGDGKHLKAEKVGSLRLAYAVNNKMETITLHNVKYAPNYV